jgi:hypothetical protein
VSEGILSVSVRLRPYPDIGLSLMKFLPLWLNPLKFEGICGGSQGELHSESPSDPIVATRSAANLFVEDREGHKS